MPFFVFDKVILAFQENNDTIFYVLLYTSTTRKDAGVVERAALEMRWAGNRSLGSNPSLSAERAGQKWSANGQKATNQWFVAFFIARKSCFQDFKSTVKDKVSLLNRYLFPAGQKR